LVNAEIYTEEEMTQETLLNLFRQAFLKTAFTAEGDLVVHTEGPSVLFEINDTLKTLKMMAAYRIRLDTPMEKKLALVNQMNDDVALGRFSIPAANPDFMIADCMLVYENGIAPYTIVASLRLFAKAVSFAIRTYDTEELVNRRDG